MKTPNENGAGVSSTPVTSNRINPTEAPKLPKNPRKKKPAMVEMDDEEILANITELSQKAAEAEHSLARAIAIAAENDIDRDDVIAAMVEGGYAESTARSKVSKVYNQSGKEKNKKGQGRPVPPEAAELLKYVQEKYGADKAASILGASARLAKKTEVTA